MRRLFNRIRWFLLLLLAPILDSVAKWVFPDDYQKFKANISPVFTAVVEWWESPSELSVGSMILIIAAVILILGFTCLLALRIRGRQAVRPSPAHEEPPFEPSILQNKILRYFWGLNAGKRESANSISEHTDYSSNEVMHALDGLFDLGYLGDNYDVLTGRSFFLNEEGRKLCSGRFGHPAALAKAPASH